LRALSDEERFLKVRSGEWRVVFEKTKGEASEQGPQPSEPADALVTALVACGVSPSTARSTVKQFPATRIQPQREVFDYLVAQKDPKVSRNPPGFLLSAIRGEYAPPKGFLDHAAQERRRRETEERRAREARRKEQQQAAVQAREEAREGAIAQCWQSFSAAERDRMEKEAVNQATSAQHKVLAQGGTLAAAARKTLLDAYALKVMGEGN
jgi:hypothetical protein